MKDKTEGQLPEGWQWVKLGEICDLKYGFSLPAKTRQTGLVPVYGSNGLVGKHDVAATKGPTLVIGRKGSIGEVHYSHTPCWPIDTTYFIDQTKRNVDLTWLYYCLTGLDLRKLNKAAAVPGLNRDDVYAIDVPLPSPFEQKAIAERIQTQFTTLEEACTTAEAQLTTLRMLPAAILRAAFNPHLTKEYNATPPTE